MFPHFVQAIHYYLVQYPIVSHHKVASGQQNNLPFGRRKNARFFLNRSYKKTIALLFPYEKKGIA